METATQTAMNYINGAWCLGAGDTMTVKNPSNLLEVVGEVAFANIEQAQTAVDAAQKASRAWKELTASSRGQYLYNMAKELEAHAVEIAELASREMGKPLAEMKGEVMRGVHLLTYYAAEGVRSDGDVIPSNQAGVLQYTKRTALGVVALITPWNFPVAIPIWKLAPALICGNTVIWKPAENASLTATKVLDVFEKAGLPAGVVNLIHGRGQEIGAFLSEHAAINALSFTGSTQTGLNVAAACAKRNIKYQTEMGGKNAAIVLNDADLAKAVPAIISGAFSSAGQKCTATSRLIVEEGVYDDLISELKNHLQSVKLGNALENGVFIGPVATEAQYEKVKKYIQLAKDEADILYEHQDLINDDGYYIQPLIVTGIDSRHPLFHEEVFGPLVAVLKVKNYEEAIEVLNNTDYGLSASLFTNDLGKAHRFLNDADIGMVRVNQETAGVEYQAPFGGMKQSSSHTREQGQAALDFYSIVKTCAIKY
ncbi:aldehyde dehydrogenase family protein [Camelliibacillus cellulosilyticus]|uniref:Aldehyde dehydrogenase family protein n=1 Tax=Camelliibacillus cellulosilyticus TaxID=2174486 RepID=A0ABV9GNF4_9BACL